MQDHQELLKDYALHGNEGAFRDLVSRYVDLVYSVALRRLNGDTHLAQDAVQMVFCDLAKKARQLTSVPMLGGWLHRHTCFVSSTIQRTEQRRQTREQWTVSMNELHQAADENESQIKTVLDEAIDKLESNDRQAVILRFFEKQTLRNVGTILGITEDAAQKRVSRALEKLRGLLSERGITMSITGLSSMLESKAITAAPSSLANHVSQLALENALKSLPFSFLPTMLEKITLKTGLAAVALLTVMAFLLTRNSEKNTASGPVSEQSVTAPQVSNIQEENAQVSSVTAPPSTIAVKAEETSLGDRMELKVLDKKTASPISGAAIRYHAWEGEERTNHDYITNDQGIALIDVPFDTITRLELVTRIDGYADTSLNWYTDRGEWIPLFYTVQLDEAVPISGTVVDHKKQPMSGAIVGFGNKHETKISTDRESHDFKWIEVETDTNGRWHINRIASELIPHIYGSAKHPSYVGSEYKYVNETSEMEEQLRSGTFQFSLRPAGGVYGTVKTSDGIPIGDAHVLIGKFGESNSRTTKTAADGSFELLGCLPGKNLATASAPGFTPKTIRIDINNDMSPIQIVLEPAKKLFLKVVDALDRPIPNASIWSHSIESIVDLNSSEPPVTQVMFRETTDQDGRAVWSEPPNEEMPFGARASGHMEIRDILAKPDGTEYIITLPPAVVIYGTVRDAETLNSVDTFTIEAGIPGPNQHLESRIHWSRIGRHSARFGGGTFRHSFEEPLAIGLPNPGYVLRFDADGYSPYVTRAIKPDEGEVAFDILLENGEDRIIQALLPNEEPAVNADVKFISDGEPLEISNGRLPRETNKAVESTNPEGEFQLNYDHSIKEILIVHPDGIAMVSPQQARKTGKVQLLPWARIEGQYVSETLKDGMEMIVQQLTPSNNFIQLAPEPGSKLDSTGQFIIEKVPPGHHRLMLRSRTDSPQMGSWNFTPLTTLDISPGSTLNILITGHTVTFQLSLPPSLNLDQDTMILAGMHTDQPEVPQELGDNIEERIAWASQPEIRSKFFDVKKAHFQKNTQDTWVANHVMAGDYILEITVQERLKASNSFTIVAKHEYALNVPENSTSTRLDLGTLILKPVEEE
jgi:RNA polymerase sigma factor (sigma-70 family)